MKVLNVINVRWFNATAWYSHMLSLGLRELGHDVAVFGLPNTPPVLKAKDAEFRTFEAELNSLNPLKLFKSALAFKKAVKEFDPDLVVCHRGEFFFYFAHVRFWEKPKWKLVRVRGDRRPPQSGSVSRLLYQNVVDKVVTSSEMMRKVYLDKLSLKEQKVITLYGGVDTAFFRKDDEARYRVRNEFNIKDEDYVLGIVGRFDPIKGHDSLFSAVSELYHGGMKNLRLIVAGVESHFSMADMETKLKEHNIANITNLVGKRDDIADVMCSFDLGVIPSLGSEAVCRVGMEMMACGVSVIGSDVGVIPEILPSSNIFFAGDAKGIVEKINAHKKYQKKYDHIDFAENFVAIFN